MRPRQPLFPETAHRSQGGYTGPVRPLPPPSAFQFERTKPLRLSVYREARLAVRSRIIEVGAGDGPVAAEAARRTGRRVWALDLLAPAVRPAGVRFVLGDALRLPVRSGALDAVILHFVLLWLPDPARALREIRRALGASGVLLLLAEPDLTRREDEPATGLGRALERAVRASGGHPDAGARTGEWLKAAGFHPHLRQTGPEWVSLTDPAETEWEIRALRESGLVGETEAARLLDAERLAAASGPRRVFLPLTFGWAARR